MSNWQTHHEKFKQHEKARNELKNATGRIPLENKHIADAHFDAMKAHQDIAHYLRVTGKARPTDIDRAHKLSATADALKEDLDETVLDVAQRQKRAQIMRRYKAKIARSRELAKKKMAPEKNIKKRAYAQARQIVRRKVAGKRGAEYEKLGPSEKMAIDRAVEGKQKIIKKIALRLIPRVKQAEQQRLSSFMKGQALQNHGKIEGGSGSSSVQEELNHYFAEQFPPMAERSERKQPTETTATIARKKGGKEVKGNSNVIQHGKFEEERDCNTAAYKAIAKKAANAEISEDILGEVYDRGLEAWYEETGVSQQQYAFARVNSFINQGKSYFNEDADLQELSRKTLTSYLQKTKAGGKDYPTPLSFRKSMEAQGIAKAKLGKNPKRSSVPDVKIMAGGKKSVKEDSDLQELSKATLTSYLQKTNPSTGGFNKLTKDKWAKRTTSRDLAKSKNTNEDADLQEISSKTLDRYVNRAVGEHGAGHRGAQDARDEEKPYWARLRDKRKAGIARAIDKQDAATGRTPEKPVKVPASMKEDADLQEARPENNPTYDYTEKMWNARKASWEADQKKKKQAQMNAQKANEELEEGTMKPYVKPHYGDTNNPERQTGWKSANKHGKTKYWQTFAKSSAEKHAGINEENELDERLSGSKFVRKYIPKAGKREAGEREKDELFHASLMRTSKPTYYDGSENPDHEQDVRSGKASDKAAKRYARIAQGKKPFMEERAVELHDGGPSRNIKKATLVGDHKTKPDHVIIRTHNYLGKPTDLVIHKSWIKEELEESYSHLSTADLRKHAEDAIRKNDRQKVKAITQEIKSRIEKKTGTTYVAPKKVSAKTASDFERLTGKKVPAHRVEEVQQTNENFIDGKGPGKPGDAARHGLKGKSAAELRKIRSSETASPRKKQLAHFMLNMTKNEETELDEKRGLWDNIHAKRKRIKAGSGERMRRPGSEGAPTKQNFRDAQEEVSIPDDLNKKLQKVSKQLHKSVTAHAKQRDIIKSLTSKDKKDISEGLDSDHYKALTDIELNTKNRDMTTQKDGYGPLNPLDEKGSKNFWDEKAKMWNTTVEAAKEARCGNCAFFNQSPPVLKKIADGIGERGETVSDLAGFGFCELWEFKCAALRTCNTWVLGGPIKEETENGTQIVDKESKNSKLRRRIEKVDRSPPHTEHGKQQAIQKKIIDEEGNSQPDPKKRLVGTKELVKAYKKDTPGQSLDESFNIAFASGVGVTLTARDLGMHAQGGFALHPSVIKEIEEREQEEVEEEVRSADVKGEVVPAHAVIKTRPDGSLVNITVPGHVRRGKANRKIIGSGNLTDGKPDDTL